jgi:hypothetical protein
LLKTKKNQVSQHLLQTTNRLFFIQL